MATVKVQCESGEIYRLTLQEEASFTSVVQLVADCCPEVQVYVKEGGICPLKYADEEQDWCTLAPATFDDFMSLQSNKRLLKLRLKPTKELPDSDSNPVPNEEIPGPGPPPGLENEKEEREAEAQIWK